MLSNLVDFLFNVHPLKGLSLMASLSFCPTLQQMHETRRLIGRSGKVYEGLGALSTINNLTTIRALMLELAPTRTLEIGMAYGGSALAFAQTHKDLGSEPTEQHIAIDPAQSKHWDNTGRLALEHAGLRAYVCVIEEYSSQALPYLVQSGCAVEMVYIDGSHQFEDVLLDFVYTHELLKVGGLMLFDDSSNSHVRKVLDFIEANYSAIYERVPLYRYRETFKQRLKIRVASVLHKNQLTAYRKLRDGRQNWGKPLAKF